MLASRIVDTFRKATYELVQLREIPISHPGIQ